MPTWLNAGAVREAARIKPAIHFVFIVLLLTTTTHTIQTLTQRKVSPPYVVRRLYRQATFGEFMTHPLHSLGFEPISPPSARAAAPLQARPDGQPMESSPSKNGEPEKFRKGTRVRMADGALGRVVYADPNLRIARVRTDDGRNVTVRRKTLTQVKP